MPEFTLADIETIYVLRPTQQPTRLRFLVDFAKDGDTAQPGEAYEASELEQLRDKGVHRVKGRQQSVRVFGIDRGSSSGAVADRAQSA